MLVLPVSPVADPRRSPTRGVATAFPHAKIVTGPSATPVYPHRRQLLSSRRWGDAGSTTIVGGVEVPWYCREGAGVLQVSPEPGDAAIFWCVGESSASAAGRHACREGRPVQCTG